VGYRVAVDGEVLNVLRWSVANRDAREQLPPEKMQERACFLGHRPAIVTRAEFRDSGFTRAHLEGARFTGYRVTSTMVTETRRMVEQHEPFTYVYYDGLDKVSHEYGLGEHYDAELADIDRLVAEIVATLPPEATLVVTADHGQVDVGARVIKPAPEVLAATALQSGEGRFRWLHAQPGSSVALEAAAREHHEDVAWVVSRQQVLDEGWFGPVVGDDVRARLGDVALVARDDVAFDDPADTGPYLLVGRHGSLTEAEVRVPLLAVRGA
jgi:predicted AlkP superfamily pyrophosphatase or phosphodiesterase